jgi:hypothetical protein
MILMVIVKKKYFIKHNNFVSKQASLSFQKIISNEIQVFMSHSSKLILKTKLKNYEILE